MAGVRDGFDVTDGVVIGGKEITQTKYTLHNGDGLQQGKPVYAKSEASALRELAERHPHMFDGVGIVNDGYEERYGPYELRIHE